MCCIVKRTKTCTSAGACFEILTNAWLILKVPVTKESKDILLNGVVNDDYQLFFFVLAIVQKSCSFGVQWVK